MVDDDFVAAIRTERCLHCLGNGSTCFYVPYHSAVFGFIAGEYNQSAVFLKLLDRATEQNILLVSLLEETTARCTGYRK